MEGKRARREDKGAKRGVHLVLYFTNILKTGLETNITKC